MVALEPAPKPRKAIINLVVFLFSYAISSVVNAGRNRGDCLMFLKLRCQVFDGLMPTEKIARIESADGKLDEVSVSGKNLVDNGLMVSEIGRSKDRVLVELPSESASGRWRVWVKVSSIGA